MKTGAKIGVAPSDYSIRVGTVRMEEHPDYQNLIDQIINQGFLIIEDREARVSYIEVINTQKEVIRVEKELYIIPDMRYIDLEHEFGHIRQLERFDGKLYTDRFMEKPNGNLKRFNDNADDILHGWRNIVTELHNRLQEFLRLLERDANPELLLEHSSDKSEGITKWLKLFNKHTRKKNRLVWIDQYFPDLIDLRKEYAEKIDKLRKIYPDFKFY